MANVAAAHDFDPGGRVTLARKNLRFPLVPCVLWFVCLWDAFACWCFLVGCWCFLVGCRFFLVGCRFVLVGCRTFLVAGWGLLVGQACANKNSRRANKNSRRANKTYCWANKLLTSKHFWMLEPVLGLTKNMIVQRLRVFMQVNISFRLTSILLTSESRF